MSHELDEQAAGAALDGRVEVLAALLRKGADPDSRAARHGPGLALFNAIEADHPTCVEVLLSAGADPNIVRNGQTLLAHAVDCSIDHAWQRHHEPGHENTEIVELMLRAGGRASDGVVVAAEYGSNVLLAILEASS